MKRRSRRNPAPALVVATPLPRARLPIAAAFILSLAAHALLVPFLVYMLASPGTVSAMQERFAPQDPDEPRDERPPLVELGIDAQTPESFTWIGYEEYQEHMARLAEVEQAAFAENPVAAGRPAEESGAGEANAMNAPPGAADAPRVEPVDSNEPEPVKPVEPIEPVQATAPKDEQPREPQSVPPPDTAITDAEVQSIQFWLERVALGEVPSDDREKTEAPEKPVTLETRSPTESEEPPRALDPISELVAQLVQQAAERGRTPDAISPPNPAEPAPAGAPEAQPGERSDKESEPTSLIELEVRELGKPIARPGLEIKPQRPHITHLVSLTASPANPLVILRFGADGRPREARIVESSRDSRVDHAIQTSLYRWRASGASIDALGPDETVDVQIRILLGRR